MRNQNQTLSKKFQQFWSGSNYKLDKRWSTPHVFCWRIFIKLFFTCTKKVNWVSFWRILVFWDFSGIGCLVYSWENLMSLIFPLGTERILQSHNPRKRQMELLMYKTCSEKKSLETKVASSFNITIILLNTEHNQVNVHFSFKIPFN